MRYSDCKFFSFPREVPVGDDLKEVDVNVYYDEGHFLEINIDDDGRDLWDELLDNVRDSIAVTAGEKMRDRAISEGEYAYESFYDVDF